MSESPSRKRIEAAAIRLFSERGNTQITVQELARAAGCARGTVYNNVGSTEDLFTRIAAGLADEMTHRVMASIGKLDDPALGLAHEIRFFVRRAHTEPDWGWFVYRFGLSNKSLRNLLEGVPMRALVKGRQIGRYEFRDELLPGAMAMIAGCTLSAAFMVLEGHQTWRIAGSSAAELVLRALGIPPLEAQRLAHLDLPPLVAIEPT